jgi:hypothetical protein
MSASNGRPAGGADEYEMGTERNAGISPAIGELMIAGQDVGPVELSRLLAAATAPPYDHETAGEEAAVFAFRSARSGATAQPAGAAWSPRTAWSPRHEASSSLVGRWAARLGVKAGVAVGLAVAVASAALAAGTGVLPNPFEPPGPAGSVPASSTGPSQGGSTTRSGSPPASPGAAVSPGPPATVPASVVGLCEAYLAQDDVDKPDQATSPVFAPLIEAAGGAESVPEYCATILSQSPPSQGPRPTGPPTERPGVAPQDQFSHPGEEASIPAGDR